MKDFRNLTVWQKSHRLALETYRITKLFPKEEVYGLTSQMRRACVSIPANIAEGCAQRSDAAFCRHLVIALASGAELEYYFILSADLGFMKHTEFTSMLDELTQIKKMLNSFIQKLSAKS
jgi:four helix bundle protein